MKHWDEYKPVVISTPKGVSVGDGDVFFGFNPSDPMPVAEVSHGTPCGFCRGIVSAGKTGFKYCPVCHATTEALQAALDLLPYATNEPDAEILKSYEDVIEEPFRLPPEELAPEPGVIAVSDLRGDDRRSYRSVAGLGRRATP